MGLCQSQRVFPKRDIAEVEAVRFLSVTKGSYSTSIEGAPERAIWGFAVDQRHQVVHETMGDLAQRHVEEVRGKIAGGALR